MDRGRIAAHAFMAGVPEKELDAVTGAASGREFAAGEALNVRGRLRPLPVPDRERLCRRLGRCTSVGRVGPGEVVGEVAVLASGRRTASVVATSPIRAISFFKRDVWALERTAPEAARRLRAAIKEHAGSA